MKRKHIKTNEVKLAYIEKNPKKSRIIFFIHGNSSSADFWDLQLKSKQLKQFRLIAFDLPAHGHSNDLGSDYVNYSFINIAGIISEAVYELAQDQKFLLCGCSLGTNIIAEILNFNIKPFGIVLIGPTITGSNLTLDKVFIENPSVDVLFTDLPDLENYKLCIRDALMIENPDIEAMLIRNYVLVKAPFRSSIMPNFLQGRTSDHIILLQRSKIPVLVIFGKNEKNVQIDYLDRAPFQIWQDHIYKIELSRHFTNIDRAEKVNELLNEYFLNRILADSSVSETKIQGSETRSNAHLKKN